MQSITCNPRSDGREPIEAELCEHSARDRSASIAQASGSARRLCPIFRPLRAIALFALSHALVASADEGAALRIADVLDEARSRSPEIVAARQKAEAAAAVPSRMSAYDDPTFSYEAWNTPESFDIARADNNILSISQRVPFPGKRMLAGKIAESEAEMERRSADRTELETLAAVKRAFYDLWQGHQELAIHSRDRELVEEFAKIAEEKYAVGEVSQSDALRAQVERTRLINRVTTSGLAVQTARAELARLLSRPSPESLAVPESPPAPVLVDRAEPLVERAVAERPEVGAQAAEVERAERVVRLAKLDYLPDVELTASRFVNYRADDGWGAMASISLPLAYRGKYDAAVAEANARLSSARAELTRVQDQVRKEVVTAFLAARTALLQRDLFLSTHIPQAEQALAASQIAYQTGKLDFLALVDSLRAIESIHLEHVRAEADFERAYADLERAVGAEIPRGTGS